MINQESIDTVNALRWSNHFMKPAHSEGYCFSQIPQFVHYLLTEEGELGFPPNVLGNFPHRYDKVVLLYVDAFGWRFFQQFVDQFPFLKRFSEQGIVSKITSQFPSTTAAHLTAIHLGQPVAQTGIYEWFYYEPLLDRLIAPLIFSYAGDRETGTIKLPEGVGLKPFFPDPNVYEKLAMSGVRSHIFQSSEYNQGGFANLALAGAQRHGFKTMSEGLLNLADAIVAEKSKAYFFYYFDPIDAIGHRHGPSSRHFAAEVESFMIAAEQLFHSTLSGNVKNTLVLLTADHGQVDVSPDTTIYLNHHIPELKQHIRTDGEGRLLVPAGSARDIFFYIKEGRVDDAYELLKGSPLIEGKAEVHRVRDLINRGFFGTTVSENFRQRIADIVILPYEHDTVWWYEKGRFDMEMYGHHGGLTPAEMEIPMLALPYGI
ncbi:MAG: alkaline phosphatase family protein [Anaerolineae bacterium]